jgi:phenylalanyl-tRNA synthetase beta chain
MLDVAASNLRFTNRVALFELGTVFLTPRDGESEPGDLDEDKGLALPLEPRHLAIVLSGPRTQGTWQPAATTLLDFYDLKGIVEEMVAGLHVRDVSFTAANHPMFHPGRAAQLRIGETQVGIFGELHPLTREKWELPPQPVLVGEFDLEAVLPHMDERFIIKPISRYPVIVQDIALIVDENVNAAPVEALIRQTGGALLNDVKLFDIYRGAPLPEAKKSLAYTLTFQALDHVLSDSDVGKVRDKIVRRLEREVGAELRSG